MKNLGNKGAGVVEDPALKMSELYAARGAGRQPGTLTQHEREAKVRASIPGGEKELPSEVGRKEQPLYLLLRLRELWTDPRLCQTVPDCFYRRIQHP